jgi:HEAT repeat protein
MEIAETRPPIRPEDENRARGSLERMEARGYGPDPAGLEKALLEGPDVATRAEAAFLLGYQHADAARQSLRQALSDESARVRVEAALALARIGDLETSLPILKRELKGEFFQDAPLRAARALYLLGDPTGYPRVVEALDSEFPSNRMEAIAVLPSFLSNEGQTVGGQRVDPLERLIRAAGDPEPLLRRDALKALAAIDDPRAAEAVRLAAKTDPDPQVREYAQQLM